MSSVKPYLAADHVQYADSLPQLHNDIINFAVAAGGAGVLLYFAMLLTPLLTILTQARDRTWAPRLFGVSVLTAAYFCDGLTDLMFGFEYHTALFVVIAAILLAYSRGAPPRRDVTARDRVAN